MASNKKVFVCVLRILRVIIWAADGGYFFETGMLYRYVHSNNSINCNQARVFFI